MDPLNSFENPRIRYKSFWNHRERKSSDLAGSESGCVSRTWQLHCCRSQSEWINTASTTSLAFDRVAERETRTRTASQNTTIPLRDGRFRRFIQRIDSFFWVQVLKTAAHWPSNELQLAVGSHSAEMQRKSWLLLALGATFASFSTGNVCLAAALDTYRRQLTIVSTRRNEIRTMNGSHYQQQMNISWQKKNHWDAFKSLAARRWL